MSDLEDIELSPREQRVCDAFLRAGCMSQGDAYATEYDGRSAAYKFFKRDKIRKYIQDCQQQAMELSAIGLARILEETAALAFSNLKHVARPEYLGDEGGLDFEKMPDYVSASVQSVKVTGTGGRKNPKVTEIKLHPKTPALDMLLRQKGAYEKDNNQRAPDALVDVLQHVAQRGLPKPGEND